MQKAWGYAIAAAILCVLLVGAYLLGTQAGRADGAGARAEAEGVGELAASLGRISEELREDYERIQEQATFLERNNRVLGEEIISARIVASELAIRNRELIAYATELEGALRGFGVDLDAVAADIGSFVPGTPEDEVEAHP